MSPKKKKKKLSKKAKKRLKRSFFGRLFDDEEPLLTYTLSEQAGREVSAIALAVAAIVILFSLIGLGGAVGQWVSLTLRHLLGLVAFLLPILLGVGAAEFFKPKGSEIRLIGAIGGLLFLLAFPALLHTFWLRDSLGAAEAGFGGGLVGHTLSLSLTQAVGLFLTVFIELGLTLIAVILVFDISLTRALGLVKDEDKGVTINQPGKAPVFETVRRFGFRRERPLEKKQAAVTPAATSVLTSASQSGYQLPSVEMLETSDTVAESGDIPKNAEKIQKTLADFGIIVTMGRVNVGPTVTQYTCKPAQGVKLNQITARANDLALALAAKSIRIEAPIPGQAAVGIEVPNPVRAKVTIREILSSDEFAARHKESLLAIALGLDVAGAPLSADIESMPHMLVAGATGSGKSVMINSIILSLLFQNTPETLRLILVDPKRVELSIYNHIPHLLTPVITEADKTIAALKWAVSEMDRRYKLFSETGRRNMQSFNEGLPSGQQKMPYIVLIIDELADLMSVAARDVEGAIVRLAQMARATGIHLIVATQRPSVDVITGLIKANITSRLAFATASQADSRTILDMSGSEKLLGNGDMLFVNAELGKPRRVQGAFSSDKDIAAVIAHVKAQGLAQYDEGITSHSTTVEGAASGVSGGDADDEMYRDAVAVVMEAGKGSASLLQRRLRIGYARAARLLDILENNGVIGPADGARPREVYGESSAAATTVPVAAEPRPSRESNESRIQSYKE